MYDIEFTEQAVEDRKWLKRAEVQADKKVQQNELQVIEPKDSFNWLKESLHREISQIDSGNCSLMEMDKFDKELERILTSYN